MKTQIGAMLTIGAVALVVAMPAFSDDIRCTGTIGARTVDGNVIVPSGRSCTLAGTTVKGNVLPEGNSQLFVRSGAFIEGSVQTDGADRVRIRDSEVNGNVQLTGIDYSQGSLVLNSRVGGTVDWWDNSAEFLIRYSTVDSDVKVNQNSALAKVYDNAIGGNLQCQANQPPPVGARNVVDGNKEDQCKRF